MVSEIDKILDPNEKILWRGKPKYIAYILRVLPVTIFGLFWSAFLVPFYWVFFTQKTPPFVLLILIPHTLLSVMLLGAPLWASLWFPYIEYAITNKRIIIKSGFFARNFVTVDYATLADVSVDVGLLGRLTGTGDLHFVSGMGIFIAQTSRSAISNIENPYEVFKLLKQTYFDIKTDVEFPNKFRPVINPGYQTDYQPPSE